MARRLCRRGHRYRRHCIVAAPEGAVENSRVPTRRGRDAIDSPVPARASSAPGRGAFSLGFTSPAAAPASAGLPPANLRQPSRLIHQRALENGQTPGRWPSRPPTERGVKRFAPRSGCQRLTAENACPPWWHKSKRNRVNDRGSQSDLLGAHVGLRPRRGRASFLAWSGGRACARRSG